MRQTVDVGRTSAQQFSKFRTEVAGLFTTLATGFGLQKFVRDVAGTEAGVGRLAKNIGTTVTDLNTFQEAAKRFGGSYEATGQSLLGLTQQYQQFSLGMGSSAVGFLRALNVDWADATGKMRPIQEIMRDLNRAVQGMDKPRANALLSGLGLDQGTITLLEQTTTEYDKLISSVQKQGTLTESDTKKAENFQANIAKFEQSILRLKTAIANDLLPIFEQWMGEVSAWLDKPENQKFVRETVHQDIAAFARGIRFLIDTFKEWHGVAEALAAYIGTRWLLAMTVGLGPVGAAIAAIAAGFVAIQKAADFFDPSKYSNNSIFWKGVSKEEQLKYPNSPESRKARGGPEVDPNEMNPFDPSTWFRGHGFGKASDERKATVRDRLSADLGISKEAASGIVSPLNAESGIAGINEVDPTVPGSRGGFGWAQWTGPRRDDFEAYAKAHGLNPASDDANYGFLTEELRTKYPNVLAQLKRGSITPTEAANIVTRQYIVPGIPGQSDFETKVQRHIVGADDVSKIDGSKPASNNAPMHGYIIDPIKSFFNKNFGGSDPAPTPKPDPSLSGYNMSPAQRDAAANQRLSSSSSVETNINGPITINTQAKDADGIAKSLGGSLKKYAWVAQANSGLA